MSTSITPNDFFKTMVHNLDNEKMDDKAFREFVRNSTRGITALPSLCLIAYGRDVWVEASHATLTWLKGRLDKADRLDNFLKDEVRFLPKSP